MTTPDFELLRDMRERTARFLMRCSPKVRAELMSSGGVASDEEWADIEAKLAEATRLSGMSKKAHATATTLWAKVIEQANGKVFK